MHHPKHPHLPSTHSTHSSHSRPIRNGMPARELDSRGWSKPWSDDAGGACVEVMKLADGRVAVRQSTDPDSPALVFTPNEMTSFLAGVKAGAADFLL